MSEEFARIGRFNSRSAAQWYWKQTLRSAPSMALVRLREMRGNQLFAIAFALVGAFIFVTFWDIYISRNAARGFHALTSPESFAPARRVYFLTQILGALAAGAVVAAFGFTRSRSLARNITTRLAPIALLLSTPTFIELAAPAEGYPSSTRILMLALSLPAYLAGAWLYWNRRMR